MREYETNKHHTPSIIYLQACSNSSYCPVHALNNYLASYKHAYICTTFSNYGWLTNHEFSDLLSTKSSESDKFIALNPDQFKGFRIGERHMRSHQVSLIMQLKKCVDEILTPSNNTSAFSPSIFNPHSLFCDIAFTQVRNLLLLQFI